MKCETSAVDTYGGDAGDGEGELKSWERRKTHQDVSDGFGKTIVNYTNKQILS